MKFFTTGVITIDADTLHDTLKKIRFCRVKFRLSEEDDWRSGRLMSFHVNRMVDDRGIVAAVHGDDDESYTIPLHKGSDLIEFLELDSEHVESKVEEYESTDWDEVHDVFSRWEHRPDIEVNDNEEGPDQAPEFSQLDDDFDTTEFLEEHTDYEADDGSRQKSGEEPTESGEESQNEEDDDVNRSDLPEFATDWPLFIVKLKSGKWIDLNALGEPLRDSPERTRKKLKPDGLKRIRKFADNIWMCVPDGEEHAPFDVDDLRDQFDVEEA